ncbi:TPA: hypothetical protein ACPWS4_003796 [Pseudomonas aeruginosa]
MQKISDSTNTANGSGEFTEGNPSGGVDATLITAAWLNALQREVINVLAAAGLSPVPASDDQLRQAISALVANMANGKVNKTGDTVSGTLTLYNGTTDAPDLRWNNTMWNAYIDLFQNQLGVMPR